jgi:beta-glucosidase
MRRASVCLIGAAFLFLSSTLAFAQAPTAPAGAAAPQAAAAPRPAPSPANVPFHNERNDARHQTFVDIAKKGDIDLLFVGDSITDWFYWPRGGGEATGGKVWEANFAPLKAANFAIAGDTTQGVLWRMQNGELSGFKAKLIVLMLGTNNTASNPVGQIIEGDRLIV